MVLRVLSIPGKSHENRYFSDLLSELERRDIVVLPTSAWSCLSLRFDILHLNFPTHYITEYGLIRAMAASLLLALYLAVVRLKGCKIVYTVHDVVPLKIRHDILLRYFLSFFLEVTNGFIFLSRSSRSTFEKTYARHALKPWELVPHGPYSANLMSTADRVAAREQIIGSNPAFVVGFLGAIKHYKNFDALAELPEQTEDGRSVHVVVAGKVEPGYEDNVRAVMARLQSRVTRVDRRLTDAELDYWIQTVDLVLLPYTRGSNSGSALLVLSNHARFAASDLAAFQDLFEQVGRPWVYCLNEASSDRQTYTQLINQAARESADDADQGRLSTYLEKVSWSAAASVIDTFYRSLSSNRKAKRTTWRTT